MPHVVADAKHIICDFNGYSTGWQTTTESRTLYCGPDTWSLAVEVTDLGMFYSSYCNGGKLAIDRFGKTHLCLMMYGPTPDPSDPSNICYTYSTDHGATWAQRETVNDVTGYPDWDPSITADSDGYAYLVWQDGRNGRNEIWFATNNPAGITKSPVPRYPVESLTPQTGYVKLSAEPSVFTQTTTIHLPASPKATQGTSVSVWDACGHQVRSLAVPSAPSRGPRFVSWNGSDKDGCRCAPGVYIVRAGNAVEKVVLLLAQ